MTDKKKPPERFAQEDRVKLDARISREVDDLIEACAAKLGTTKNSVVSLSAAIFAASMIQRMDGAAKGAKARAVVDKLVAETFDQ